MGQCPKGMKPVPAGRVNYTAYSYPRGPQTCKPLCKPGWRKRYKVPAHIKRYTVRAPCPWQKCTYNKPVKKTVIKSVKKFCISKPAERDRFTLFAQKSSLITWAKAGLLTRLKRNKSNTLPVREQVFVNMNNGVAATAPVRGVPIKAARIYCKAMYGRNATLPTEAQWEYAYGKGKIKAFAKYMELLSTRTRTNKGWMDLLISGFAKPGFRWAMSAGTMAYIATFRCVAPVKSP